ncbi:MAG: alpha/beta hydrolase [Devosia sp.]
MDIVSDLRQRATDSILDRELLRLSPGLRASLRVQIGDNGFRVVLGENPAVDDGVNADVTVQAEPGAWAEMLKSPPPPTFHSFTALQLANPAFRVMGEPEIIGRARPALERIFEIVAGSVPMEAKPVARDIRQIRGGYHPITIDGTDYDVYCDEAGAGTPVLFLHTAGADGRQFQAQLADTGLAKDYHMFAVDLPFHGRSMPPRSWTGEPYKLTAALYSTWCAAIIRDIIGEPAIVAGGSMGAAMAMVMAADFAPITRGIVAIEPPFQSKGRRNPYQNHVSVHGGLHNASYVRGLMSPTSPQTDRRRASWIYSQGAPGIYPGDLSFYSDEFDGAIIAPKIDTAATPVALLSGTYDYSATPADGRKLNALIPGSLFVEMDGLGHFPMVEHPDHFRGYFVQALDFLMAHQRS